MNYNLCPVAQVLDKIVLFRKLMYARQEDLSKKTIHSFSIE